MNTEKRYYSKILLAGEYAVLVGGEALAAPLTRYSAFLRKKDDSTDPDKLHMSVSSLRNLIAHIQGLPKKSFYAEAEIKKLDELIKHGYYVESDIPHGYGIGSSAAITALVYDRFFKGQQDLDLLQLRKDLSTIESLFHGKSSGIDALTSYLNTGIYVEGGNIERISSDLLHPEGGNRFFLLDSELRLETGPLVQVFLEKMRKEKYSNEIKKDFLHLNRKYIHMLLGKEATNLPLVFNALSDLQWRLFREMIPETMENIWMEGLISHTFYLKLNGSGGGFILGLAHEDSKEMVETMVDPYRLIWL